MKSNTLKALVSGILIGGLLTYVVLDIESAQRPTPPYESRDVHVHADFLVVMDGEVLDFSKDEYQSVAGDEKLQDFHLHDNEGTILHRHAANITLGEFFSSIGYTLTDDCFETPYGESYCTDEASTLTLYADGEPVSNPDQYIFADEDQLLLYYGSSDDAALHEYLNDITDEACIYSGTCPDRGTPPPESCGLTCEV